VVVLTGLALLLTGAAAYLVEMDRIDDRSSESLSQELAEFETLRRGTDPATGQPFASADRLLTVALQTNIPDESESIVAYFPTRRVVSGAASPEFAPLASDPAFLAAVRSQLPQGGSTRLTSKFGEVWIAVRAVNDGATPAAYVPITFPGVERAQYLTVLRTYALVALVAWLAVSAGAWLVAGRLLRPVRELRDTAQDISDSDLSRRISTTGNDDLTDLGTTFNEMLDRLEGAFAQQRNFLDDAGHELRTPMTIVRGHLELMDPDDHEETQATRGLVLDEVDRMGRLVDDMIVLAKSGRPDFLRPVEVDVGMLTDDVLDKVRALGEREWKLDARGDGTVVADPQRLTQAMVQLAMNAVAHTSAGDVIAVGSAVSPEGVGWFVRDTGPGIEPADRDRIFERFQRGTESRGADGSGLGLSIVQAIARAHGGTILLDSTPGDGAIFTLAIPIVVAPTTVGET
jgi:two-component system, OmpR family, sensor kinase